MIHFFSNQKRGNSHVSQQNRWAPYACRKNRCGRLFAVAIIGILYFFGDKLKGVAENNTPANSQESSWNASQQPLQQPSKKEESTPNAPKEKSSSQDQWDQIKSEVQQKGK